MSTIQITKPKVEIDKSLLNKLKTQVNEMGQVVIHFLFESGQAQFGTYIRIWPTTYLYDQGSDHVSELVHCERIVKAPQWQFVANQEHCYFTLIFSGLPRDCSTFNFKEHCGNENGGFEVDDIARNEADIYYFRIC